MATNPQRPNSTIRYVPIKTPMFEEDLVDDVLTKHLTRTWILFFEKMIGGAAAANTPKCVFNIAVNGLISTGTDVPPRGPIYVGGSPFLAQVHAKTPPTGADLILDIKLQKPTGATALSIFGATKLVLPAATPAYTVVKQIDFAPNILFEDGDELICDVTQVGSTVSGSQVVAAVWWA